MKWAILGFVLGAIAGAVLLGLYAGKTVMEYEDIIKALLKKLEDNAHRNTDTIKVGNYCRGKQAEKQKI